MKKSYKEMMTCAKEHGLLNEKVMQKSLLIMAEFVENMEQENPEIVDSFLREVHGLIYNNHYDEEFAMADVAMLDCTDRTGKRHRGNHWTSEQIEEATKHQSFPESVTKWDRFVAYNVIWSDLNKVLTDEQIIEATYYFFFADEDFAGKNKIWSYMNMVRHQKIATKI